MSQLLDQPDNQRHDRPVTDLAVVTATWGDYGQYLPEWAGSIAAQSVLPAQAVIVDSGLTEPSIARAAVDVLTAAGIEATLVGPVPHRGMGAALNLAVAHTATGWVIRLDADDVLLPWAVEDVAELTASADVVAIGARIGDDERLFPNVTTEGILARQMGSYSASAFRRDFWQRRPYIEANDWIDSVFWVGLAHLGARFVPTTRAGFIYRQHPDSFSRRLSSSDRRRARRQWIKACTSWDLT